MAASLGQVDNELLDTSIIISACERGDLPELQRVLEESHLYIGSESLDSKGQTALHIACSNGHLHIAQYLVNEKECNVMVEDVFGHNPFVLSLINKHWKVAEFLLTVAPSSDSFKKHIGLLHYGESLVANVANEALTESCSNGYLKLVKFLKEKFDTQISETCVQSSLANGHINIASYLMFGEGDGTSDITSFLNKTWANKKWKSARYILQFIKKSGSHEKIGPSSTGLDQLIEVVPFESHAFNTACSKGYLEVVRYLHEKSLSSPSLEIVQASRFEGHLHIVHFLLKYCKCTKPDDMSEIHVACIVGDEEKVTSLLASDGATMISKTDRYGMNALHYASCEPKILRMIIAVITKENTALFNTKELILGNTPLHYAVLAGCTESVRLLLRAPGCDINLVNTKGETPLHLACRQSDIMILEMLATEEMCDLNAQNDNGDSALHITVKERMPDKYIKELTLHKSCNPNIINKQGYTPLHIATVNSQYDSIKTILNSTKCDPNIRDLQGNTALHLSIAGMKECVKYILVLIQQPTCNLNIQNDNGDTALHIAACSEWNNAEMIQCILYSGRCDPNIINKQGYTPLHIATVNSQYDSIKSILNCNPNIQDLQGNTALHLSICQKSATGIEHFLMCDKVDVNIQNRQGDTPLHVAVKQGIPVSVIESLANHVHCNVSIANNEAMTPLQLSVKMKRVTVANIIIIVKKCSHEVIKRAIEDTFDVLYNAVLDNCLVLVQALLQFQSEKVNLRHNFNETPLHATCRKGYCDMMEILLENGADVQAVDSNGDAPIHIVCKGLRLDCLKVLLQSKECDPNQQNSDGDIPLHIMCKMENTETIYLNMIEILLENGADIQAVDSNGDAPIHIVCKNLKLNCLKVLLHRKTCDPNQQNVNGDTPLHIVCGKGKYIDYHINKQYVQALISTPGIDPEIVNKIGCTPIEVAGAKYFVIQAINVFLKLKQSSIQTYLKIFVVGNSGTGKSTLIKAVTAEAFQLLKYAIFPKFTHVNPSDVPPHTAGIIPIPFNSKHFGHAVLYDFAGQHEYYSSHAAVIENLILPSPPLFLLLIDISKPIEEIKEELVYWWQFINNHSQRAAAPPHVMFVASHKDKVRARGDIPKSIIDTILKDSVRDIQVSFKFEGSFPMDCRKLVSRGLTALLTQLNTTCQVLRQTADVNLHCHILKAFLTSTDFKALVSCDLSLILKKIQTEDELLLPSEPSRLIPLLSTLSDQGHILFLQNHTDVNKSWVILKPEVLLAKVNGSIFAPDYFKEHFHNFAMSTGVVTLSKIREKFPEFHHEVVVEFLIHLQFCFRIKDKHTLEIITKNEVSLTNESLEYREEYYFFPSLVRNKNPEDVCLPQETDMYQCGWFYKCGKETEQLTTRFLHVLILRLTFSCEPPDDPTERESVVLLRSCSVWKHGIAWWNDDGIETIVEVDLQCRWVAVMMRCPDTHRVYCAEVRSKVIKIVLKAKQDFCPVITMNEFLIAPSSLQYPFEGRELTLYSMRRIGSIVIEGKQFVKNIEGKDPLSIYQLLPFEPYYKLGDLIGSFFSAEQSVNEEISQEWLEQIAIKCYKNLREFETALQPNLIAYEEECSRVGGSEVMKCVALFRTLKNNQNRTMKTWRDFEREFSRFSIFCGRDPMVILAPFNENSISESVINESLQQPTQE